MGIGGDRTEHVLWRLDNADFSAVKPKLVVLMIGTNNAGHNATITGEEVADGIKAIVAKLREKLPETKILLLAVFPRSERPDEKRAKLTTASELASKVADDKMVFFLDIGPKFLNDDGSISKEIMPDSLHLSPKGYEIWGEAIEPKVKELMGA
jgi:N-acetylglucosamine-6-sulfatase